MFKKFSQEEISTQSQIKSSTLRSIRNQISERYPGLAPYISDILPKKQQPVQLVKCRDHINLISVGGGIGAVFFSVQDGPWIPTLRLLHKYPIALPHFQVDHGAIKYLISGAQVMCPGLTSAGGAMDNSVTAGTIIAVMAEGKQHALAIAKTLLTPQQIRDANKGPALDNIHHLGDGLWTTTSL